MADIRGGIGLADVQPEAKRFMVPIQVGSATVYIIQSAVPALVVEDDRIRPVAPISPQQAFQAAGEFLHECVRTLGEKVDALAGKAQPEEITIEFSLTFEVKGKASVVPVFVTGETSAQTGLKVTAVWKPGAQAESRGK
jgi:hypothetical protein